MMPNLPIDVRFWMRCCASVIAVGCVTGAAVFMLIHGLDGFTTNIEQLPRSIGIALIYTAVMTGMIFGAGAWMERHVPIRSPRAVMLHVGSQSLATLVSFGVATVLSRLVFWDPFSVSTEVLLFVAAVAFVTTLIGSSFAYMIRFYQQLREAEAAAYDARLQALRAQINPHFLFNAFNTVAALVRTRPQEAEAVVEDLADLFRYALQSSKHETATLKQEIEAVERYLAIEKARFRDRLQVGIEVPDAMQSIRMPSMILQPIVENAVKHGVGQTDGPCTVTLTAEQKGDRVWIRVSDTGPGFDTTDPDIVCERGTGLKNVRERLSLFADNSATLTLHPQGVEIIMPG